MDNLACIYQPHFNSNCFRVDARKQVGLVWNYVVVTCSESYNGVWRWNRQNAQKYSKMMNGSVKLICVPIEDCEKVQSLEQITDERVRREVIKQQNKWYSSNVKNRDYEYKRGKPDWMLKG